MAPVKLTSLQRATYRIWLAVGVVVLGAVSLWLLYRPVGVILAPLLLALLIVYLLNPVVTWLEQRRVPRLFGTAIAYLGVIGLLVGLAAVVLPLLSSQVAAFVDDAPEFGTTLKAQVGAALQTLGISADLSGFLNLEALGQRIQEFVAAEENRATVLAILAGLSGVARGALYVLLTLLVGPVIAFYVLVDLPRFTRGCLAVVPPRYRTEAQEVSGKLAAVVGGFVRGQLVIASIVGVATSVALGVIGLPYWLLIGVIAGLANLIPLLGPFVAGLLGVAVAVASDGLGLALLVLVVMTAIQQVESSVLSPLIMGKTVRVHPLAVLLAVLIAGALYGLFGMLVAVPLVAGAKVLVQHLWETRVPWADDLALGETELVDRAADDTDDGGAVIGARAGGDEADTDGAPVDAGARGPKATDDGGELDGGGRDERVSGPALTAAED